MSKLRTKPLSGMRDFLPQDVARRQHVVRVIQRVYESYGFVPIETPTLEGLDTLLGKYGEEGDQLLYRVLHRRDNLKRALEAESVSEASLADQGLRYDLTVPLARVRANYDLPRFFKRFQIQPVWRADRPGRGRFREFYQCDVDITGVEGLVAEAEVCGAVAQVLRELGFADFRIRINDRELLRAAVQAAGIGLARESDALIALDKFDKVGLEGVRAELDARGFDAEAAGHLTATLLEIDGAADGLAHVAGRTGDPGAAPATRIRELLALLAHTPAAEHVEFDPSLARGLGYYTGPIFEIVVPDLKGSMGGGGRYDNLIGMFGKTPIPAVGFSLGLERILVVMEERGMYPDLHTGPDVMLCWRDVSAAQTLAVAHALRGQGLRVEVYPEPTKLKKQLQYAASEGVGARWVAMLGESEHSAGTVTLKCLADGTQQSVPVAEVAARVHG